MKKTTDKLKKIVLAFCCSISLVSATTVNTAAAENSDVMNAYVGNEKLLDTELNLDELKKGSGSSYKGTAWLNDELSSKIVVTTNQEVHDVEVTANDFTNQAGKVLAKENIEIKWLKEVEAKEGRNAAGKVKKYPDVIHKGGKKDIAANDVQFAWVTIKVPETTAPGIYKGTLKVSAAELEKPFELQYTIEVLNLKQPAAEATEIQVWQHPFSVANYYLGLGEKATGGITNEVRNDFYFTEEHFNLMRDSIEEYVSIGGHDAVANIVEEAWNHQSYYNDLSMVKWTKKKDGTWDFNYDWYDKWINFMIECGVLDPANGIGQIKCYSIVPWNNQIAYFDEAKGKTVKESHEPGSAEWKAMWQPFLEDFLKHSKEMGWFEITYISMDERGLDQLKPAVDMIESVTDEEGNHFKISSALNYQSPDTYEFTDRIDDISINLGNIKQAEDMKQLSVHRQALGLTTTMYTCTGDYPSNFMISDPGDNYWDIWYTMTLGTDGYMRWAWDNYVYDMHGDATYRYWEPGDGWFIYPEEREAIDESYHASFYSTPRYELFKQGIRDVAKAKYLLNSEAASIEQKTALKNVVENLKQPNKGTYQGSAVPATPEDRMLVHSETARALEATNQLAREVAGNNEKAALKAAIDSASKYEAGNYTEESWNALQKALKAANTVYEAADTTQADYYDAKEALEAAMQALTYRRADYSKIEAAIGKAEALNRADYVDFSAVENAIQAVEYDLDITHQAEVDAMAQAILAAIEGLDKKEPIKPEQPQTPDKEEDKKPNTGDVTSMPLFLSLLTTSGIALGYGMNKRRKN